MLKYLERCVSKSSRPLYLSSFQEDSHETIGSVREVSSAYMVEDYPISEER